MNLEILKIASNTKNFKDINKYTHHSKSKNPLCGDEIHIKLVISDQKIIDFGYQGKSCIYCQATASILSNKLVNYKTFKINDEGEPEPFDLRNLLGSVIRTEELKDEEAPEDNLMN